MRVLFLAAFGLCACQDETLTAYGDGGPFRLATLDGQPFAANATLDLSASGQVMGEAPCNSYSGPLTAPYPWFDLGPLRVTRRACADLAAESAFFAALDAMEFAEAVGTVLILSNSAGREMVFQSAP